MGYVLLIKLIKRCSHNILRQPTRKLAKHTNRWNYINYKSFDSNTLNSNAILFCKRRNFRANLLMINLVFELTHEYPINIWKNMTFLECNGNKKNIEAANFDRRIQWNLLFLWILYIFTLQLTFSGVLTTYIYVHVIFISSMQPIFFRSGMRVKKIFCQWINISLKKRESNWYVKMFKKIIPLDDPIGIRIIKKQ